MMCGVLLGSVSCDISCFCFLFSMNHASAFGKAEGMGGPVVFKFFEYFHFSFFFCSDGWRIGNPCVTPQ